MYDFVKERALGIIKSPQFNIENINLFDINFEIDNLHGELSVDNIDDALSEFENVEIDEYEYQTECNSWCFESEKHTTELITTGLTLFAKPKSIKEDKNFYTITFSIEEE